MATAQQVVKLQSCESPWAPEEMSVTAPLCTNVGPITDRLSETALTFIRGYAVKSILAMFEFLCC